MMRLESKETAPREYKRPRTISPLEILKALLNSYIKPSSKQSLFSIPHQPICKKILSQSTMDDALSLIDKYLSDKNTLIRDNDPFKALLRAFFSHNHSFYLQLGMPARDALPILIFDYTTVTEHLIASILSGEEIESLIELLITLPTESRADIVRACNSHPHQIHPTTAFTIWSDASSELKRTFINDCVQNVEQSIIPGHPLYYEFNTRLNSLKLLPSKILDEEKVESIQPELFNLISKICVNKIYNLTVNVESRQLFLDTLGNLAPWITKTAIVKDVISFLYDQVQSMDSSYSKVTQCRAINLAKFIIQDPVTTSTISENLNHKTMLFLINSFGMYDSITRNSAMKIMPEFLLIFPPESQKKYFTKMIGMLLDADMRKSSDAALFFEALVTTCSSLPVFKELLPCIVVALKAQLHHEESSVATASIQALAAMIDLVPEKTQREITEAILNILNQDFTNNSAAVSALYKLRGIIELDNFKDARTNLIQTLMDHLNSDTIAHHATDAIMILMPLAKGPMEEVSQILQNQLAQIITSPASHASHELKRYTSSSRATLLKEVSLSWDNDIAISLIKDLIHLSRNQLIHDKLTNILIPLIQSTEQNIKDNSFFNHEKSTVIRELKRMCKFDSLNRFVNEIHFSNQQRFNVAASFLDLLKQNTTKKSGEALLLQLFKAMNMDDQVKLMKLTQNAKASEWCLARMNHLYQAKLAIKMMVIRRQYRDLLPGIVMSYM